MKFKMPGSKTVILQTVSLVLMILSNFVANEMSDEATREIVRDELKKGEESK